MLPGYTQADIIGSPYAIVNYTVNPEIGTEDDLAAFRSRLNSKGLHLMLDFVPNHSAVDAPTTTSEPELYILGTSSCPSNTCIKRGSNFVYYGADYYNKVGLWAHMAAYVTRGARRGGRTRVSSTTGTRTRSSSRPPSSRRWRSGRTGSAATCRTTF